MGTPANSLQTVVMHWSALEARRLSADAPMTMSVDVA
jgi:hypothetical protein